MGTQEHSMPDTLIENSILNSPYGEPTRDFRFGDEGIINEIDEAQWTTLYSTKSYPFVPPDSGKIAVKVINHYGDEVLKVYKV
jgi:hypothetical protein